MLATRKDSPLVQNAGTNGQNERSRLLDYLPAVYMDDEFMGQFLMIFQSILDPIEHTVDGIPFYFDPRFTPETLLPWLASWLGLALDPAWPLARRRELVRKAADLYRWRGTRRGLAEYLRIYTGCQPEITEFIPGFPIDGTARLGVNTQLGSPGTGFHFTVTIELTEGTDINVIRSIIEAQKPAHTVYSLQLKQKAEHLP